MERVQSAIAALGLRGAVIELAVHARTSQQAADALGVTVGQIAKSLVFTVNGRPLMVIASGANRVDEAKLGRLADGKVRRASPETVKQATGYTIGGVPPLGHVAPLPIYIDQDLWSTSRLRSGRRARVRVTADADEAGARRGRQACRWRKRPRMKETRMNTPDDCQGCGVPRVDEAAMITGRVRGGRRPLHII